MGQAKAVKVHSVTQNPDGSMEVSYSWGVPPLPELPMGGLNFPSHQVLAEQISEVVDNISPEQMVLLLLGAMWYKSDPTLSITKVNLVEGKTLTFDITGFKQFMQVQ